MPKYKIELDDFTEEIFYELESINESSHGHELVISAVNETCAAMEACKRLQPLFKKHFREYMEEL